MIKGIVADLHIHGRFSRATSKNLTIANLEKWARIKGLNLLGTGDFTHPLWLKEIQENLSEENEKGILKTKTNFPFILSTEISLIYTDADKGRRVHLVLLAPSLQVVSQITAYFLKKGRIDYDGRPIFKITCPELVEEMQKIDERIEIIPAHAWTPWFGIFGSMSGFDSLKEAFHEKSNKIHAIETGMSSDPEMNWRLSELNEKTILSFSDAHSFWPFRIGREATIFNLSSEELEYHKLIDAIRKNEINGTIEVDPAYGKYHWDGHRLCNFSCSPEESKKLNRICPICKKKLVIGVDNRVEQLANMPRGFKPSNAKPFYKILPLQELLVIANGGMISSIKNWQIYNKLIEVFGSELSILLEVEKEKIVSVSNEKIAELIIANRKGNISVKPGYDGVYGIASLAVQKKLF
ncbi:DNA helicase UvrD [Candidatus Pacearchaeota archaeon CG06_land_8_20_14_3_00_35_12]|nr:MAG: DNA helicase UvrD [Candidatus Pacearchaeota archaeon CG06_land_8_20_14_3_00_35_12]